MPLKKFEFEEILVIGIFVDETTGVSSINEEKLPFECGSCHDRERLDKESQAKSERVR